MDELESLQSELLEYRRLVLRTIKMLEDIATEMDGVEKKVQISKTAGHSAMVVGGILSTIGFGLSFATFGASLVLTIAGGVVAGAGGVTAGGARIGDFVETRKRNREVQELIDELVESKWRLIDRFYEISNRFNDLIENMPVWKGFLRNMIGGVVDVGWGVAWNIIATTVRSGIKLADMSFDVGSGTVTVARTVGGTTARAFHIAGGVFGAILLPLDIGMLAYHASKVANNSKHDVSIRIKDIVSKLTCPSEREIEDMIIELKTFNIFLRSTAYSDNRSSIVENENSKNGIV